MNSNLRQSDFTRESPKSPDEFDKRFPGLARILYISYRYGLTSFRKELLERIAVLADTGELDIYLKEGRNGRNPS